MRSAATQDSEGPLNWHWFHQRRRGLIGILSSTVFHVTVGTILVLLSLLLPREDTGVFVVGEGEQRSPEDLTPIRIEMPAPAVEAGGDEQEEVVAPPKPTEEPAPPEIPDPEETIPLPEPTPALVPVPTSTPPSSSEAFMADEQLASRAANVPDGADFFGTAAAGKNFVYVLDGSFSMHGFRWQQAKTGLMESISQLSEGQAFYVIVFSDKPRPMFDLEAISPELVSATSENKQRLAIWLESVELGYETDPLPAIQLALALHPDAIFLLSDGVFSDKTREYLHEYNRVTRGNEGLGVAVHTIALHNREGERVLKRISRENGGTYRFVRFAASSSRTAAASGTRPNNTRQNVQKLLQLGAKFEVDGSGEVILIEHSGSNELLAELSQFGSLQQLVLSSSAINDADLQQVRGLPRLRHLVLDHTRITDAGVVHLNGLPLEGLFIDGTQVTGAGIAELASLPELRVLSTPGSLSDDATSALQQLRNLEILYLMEPQVTDVGVASLPGIPNLRQLYLHGTAITDAGLTEIGKIGSLSVLELDRCSISGTGLTHLSRLTGLERLSLRETDIDDKSVEALSTFASLTSLHLDGTAVGDGAIEHLGTLQGLQQLTIVGTNITRKGRSQLKRLLPTTEIVFQ